MPYKEMVRRKPARRALIAQSELIDLALADVTETRTLWFHADENTLGIFCADNRNNCLAMFFIPNASAATTTCSLRANGWKFIGYY